MAYITEELTNEIQNRCDIVDVISKYVTLTKRGKNYFGLCPFHDDHNASMSVSPEKQIYKCFSCGESGNVFTFVSKYNHISFGEAIRLLGQDKGYNISSYKEENRYKKDYDELTNYQKKNITNGPGKLCMALEIDRSFNSQYILDSDLYISDFYIDENGEKVFADNDFEVVESKRINIDYAEEAKDYLWRYYIKGNKYVSVK